MFQLIFFCLNLFLLSFRKLQVLVTFLSIVILDMQIGIAIALGFYIFSSFFKHSRCLRYAFDIVLNFMILMAICYVSKTTIWFTFLAFIGIQLQGTLYNYYYVILRNKSVGGDTTSKIFEYKTPKALPGESQKSVNILFGIYTVVYGTFDKIIHALDREAYKVKTFPNWFMTLLSLYGLGFQLLIIAVMLPLGWIEFIVPFFLAYTLLLFALIVIRKKILT